MTSLLLVKYGAVFQSVKLKWYKVYDSKPPWVPEIISDHRPDPEGKARERGRLFTDNSKSCHGLTALFHSYFFNRVKTKYKERMLLF